jgi:DNA-binding PadR family transcriptional regulator
MSEHMRDADKELAVLSALLSGQREMSGYEIAKAAHLGAGALYPILMRLEGSSLVTSRWNDGERPRRRLYALTERGLT